MANEIPPENRPSTPRAEYLAAAPDIKLIRDLLGGTRVMRDNYKLYVPKYPAEKPNSYKRRATAAKVYGGLGRTLSASVGMLFARPPEQTDNWSPDMEQHWENIDGKGTHGDVLTKRRAEDGIADGFVGILVDFPSVPDGVVVHGGNEKELNLRPLWASYPRADILSWRTATIDNVETLTQVVLREGATENVGKFGTNANVLYRVCLLVQEPKENPEAPDTYAAVWQLLEEKVDGQGVVTIINRGNGAFRDKSGAPFRKIPLAIVYAGRTDAILTAEPPLLDVAWANLEHWLISTRLEYYSDLCSFPQPTVEGELAKNELGITPQFQLGPGVLVRVAQGSKFLWTEVTGSSLQQLANLKETAKDEIAELGASFLAKKTRGVETAEAKRLDSAAENANLATSAQGIEDGINQALVFHAQYLGIPEDQAPTLTINRDFDAAQLDPSLMQVYVDAVVRAGLPARILLKAWQDGGRIAADVDIDALEMEMMANSAAEAAAQKQAEQDRLSIATGGKKPASEPPKRGPVTVKDKNGNVTHTLETAA